jgi:ABC-type multidrug transport system ATPase subunit
MGDPSSTREPEARVTLAVEAISVRRGGRVVLAGVSLEVAAGEIVGVVGKNGCGKSTLLMCIAGVLAPRDGRIVISGASVWGSHGQRLRARRALGYVPEGADPPGFLLGGELWALVSATRGSGPPTAELSDALGLGELRDVALERMSLGQRRRACLGAAFMGPPDLLVLDEPDNGLDARRLDALVALTRGHAAAGSACVLASHDAALLDQLGARVFPLRAVDDA